MADSQDDYQNEAMMDIINAGTQYGPNEANNNTADFDDGSQYLINFDDEQENLVQENPMKESASKVYLLIILHLQIIYEIKHNSIHIYIAESLCFYVHSP
jgi:hypothetical protein